MIDFLKLLASDEEFSDKVAQLFEDFLSNSTIMIIDKNAIKEVTEGFKPVDDGYELLVHFDDNANEDNIKIDLENNIIKVTYTECDELSCRIVKALEPLPKDADDSTLEASLSDGTLLITVKKQTNDKVAPHFYA